MFFMAANWLINQGSAIVKHVGRQSSDHTLLVFDTSPKTRRRKKIFFLDKGWVGKPGIDEIIKNAWATSFEGSYMYKAAMKIKAYRVELLKCSLNNKTNSAKRIEQLKK